MGCRVSVAVVPRFVGHALVQSPWSHLLCALGGFALYEALLAPMELEPLTRGAAGAALTGIITLQAASTLATTPPALPLSDRTRSAAAILTAGGAVALGSTLLALSLYATLASLDVEASLDPLPVLTTLAVVLAPVPGLLGAWGRSATLQVPPPLLGVGLAWAAVLAAWPWLGTPAVVGLGLTTLALPRFSVEPAAGIDLWGHPVRSTLLEWGLAVLELPLIVGISMLTVMAVELLTGSVEGMSLIGALGGLTIWCGAMARRSARPPLPPFQRVGLAPIRYLPLSAGDIAGGAALELGLVAFLVPNVLSFAQSEGWFPWLDLPGASVVFVAVTLVMQAVQALSEALRVRRPRVIFWMSASGLWLLLPGLYTREWALWAGAISGLGWLVAQAFWWSRTPR